MGYLHLNKRFDARENFWIAARGGEIWRFFKRYPVDHATIWTALYQLTGELNQKDQMPGGLCRGGMGGFGIDWWRLTYGRSYIYILILTMLRDTICFSFNTLIHILWCILFFSGSCVALERRILLGFWSHVYQNLASLQDLHKHTYASRCKCIKF